MLRRGLALGGGLIVLILIVLGVKGCLDARANRELSDYARNVTQIVDETDQTSKAFFGKLADPGSLSVTEFVAEVNADRSAMDNYASRVDGLSAPGDMGRAQNALELIYELRGQRDGRNRRPDADRARRRRRRQGDRGDRPPDAASCSPPTSLYAAIVRPEINGVLANNGIEGSDVPESVFLPDETKWLEESSVAEALGTVSGASAGNTSGVHGLGLSGVSINGTELGEEAVGHRRRRRGRSRSHGRKPGRIDRERHRRHGHGRRHRSRRETSKRIGAGETGTASIPLTPTPSGEVTLEVKVDTVPGEQVAENNEASYTVVFE